MLSLNPDWDRLLERDTVTLTCRGNHTEEDKSTQWWHNGTLLPNRAPSHVIASARVNDSGEYRCQTKGSELSDPVQLQVVAGEQVMGGGDRQQPATPEAKEDWGSTRRRRAGGSEPR